MKKFLKPLIIATSVAAVVGVGAVSFAKWEDSGTKSQTISNGATAVVQTLGDLKVEVSEGGTGSAQGSSNTISLTALSPVDQGSNTTSWKFTLSVPNATGDASPTYKIAGSLTKGSGTELGSAKLYWTTGTPSKTNTTNEVGEATAIGGAEVYVYLVADGTDAMNATISLTFSVE